MYVYIYIYIYICICMCVYADFYIDVLIYSSYVFSNFFRFLSPLVFLNF